MPRLVVLLLLAFAAPADATLFVPTDFREMVAASKAIVHGRISEVRSEPTARRTAIVTYVTIDVAETLKGTFGSAVTFRVPGGEVGRYRRIVIGAPRFAVGDEVIVFLTSRGPSIPYVFGLSQGVYRVSRATGRALVTPAPLMAAAAGASRVVRGDPARRPLPLDAFAAQVRAVLESPR